VQLRWPAAGVRFVLSREAPYAAGAPFAVTLVPSSATFHSAAVVELIRSWRPQVVVFDNAGRTAQLSAAHRCGARVVYISARRRQRRKAFRPRWMRLIDEHWIAYPEFIAGSLTLIERLKQRLLRRPTVRYLDVIFSRAKPADGERTASSPERGGFVLVVPRSLGEVALTRLRRFLLRTKCTLELVDAEEGPYTTTEEQIAAARPGAAEFALGLTPQCFGASFVAATVSFTKGCFTGQELVGRLDARGSSVPWRMVRAVGPSVERVDEVLRSKGPAGTSGVTTSTSDGESVVALGFAHRSLFGSDELARADDVTVEEIA